MAKVAEDPPCIIGRDSNGVVESAGPEVTPFERPLSSSEASGFALTTMAFGGRGHHLDGAG